jgi:hypothetical protein
LDRLLTIRFEKEFGIAPDSFLSSLLALSLHKIGGGSEEQNQTSLFCSSLTLHYLCTTLDLQRQTETEIEMVNLQ